MISEQHLLRLMGEHMKVRQSAPQDGGHLIIQ